MDLPSQKNPEFSKEFEYLFQKKIDDLTEKINECDDGMVCLFNIIDQQSVLIKQLFNLCQSMSTRIGNIESRQKLVENIVCDDKCI